MSLSPNNRADTRLWRTVGGLLFGVGLLVGYFSLVGIDEVRRTLWAVPPQRIASLLAIAGLALVFWGLGLRLVFGSLGYTVRLRNAVLLFSVSSFVNTITPFGQLGGDPVSAVFFTRAVDTDFETSLAAIGSLNALNLVAVVFLGLLGAGYLGATVVTSRAVRNVSIVVTGLSVAIVVGFTLGWHYRYRLVDSLVVILTPLLRGVTRVIPGVTPPTPASIAQRGTRFVAAIERLVSDPVRLIAVFALSIAGQLAVTATLWVALAALGFHAPVAIVLLLIPLAKLSGLVPTPGGIGSVEVLLGTLLVSTTGVESSAAVGAVLLYRASAFWFPSLVGGLTIGWLVASR